MTTFQIKVWNIGNNESNIEIGTNIVASSPTSDWAYFLEGEDITLDNGDKSGVIENLSDGDYVVIELTIAGTDKDIGDWITITISAKCSEDPDPRKVRTLDTTATVSMRYDVEMEFVEGGKTQTKYVEMGNQVIFNITVTNNGGTTDTIWLEMEGLPGQWEKEWEGVDDVPPYGIGVTLAQSASTQVTLTLTAPSSGEEGPVAIDITGKSVGSDEQGDNPVVSDTITATAILTKGVKLELIGPSSQSTDPDSGVSYQFELTNLGATPADFIVSFSQPTPSDDWATGDISFSQGYYDPEAEFNNLAPDVAETLYLYVTPTLDVQARSYTIEVTAEKDGNSAKTDSETVYCEVNEKYQIDLIRPIDQVLYGEAEPGKDVTYEIEIENKGNTDETVNIIIATDWKVAFGNASGTWSEKLEPKQSEVISFTLTVPEETEGDQTVDITVSVVPVFSDTINIETHTDIKSLWFKPLMMLLVPILLFVVIVVMVVVIYKRR
jgi:uncharacterized membrane protein